MTASADPRTLDVTAFFDRIGMTPFHIRLLVISSFVTLFDGLDFALISFTLPYLRDTMHLNADLTGYVTSAAFLGQMIGSLVGSYIADLMGRRVVVIWCTVLGAVFTFATGFAPNPEAIIVLRLLGGLAIGGLLAPAWALNIESMPSGMKATAVTIIMLGFSLGSAVAGQVTNFLAPTQGWQAVFWFCGVATFLLALVLVFTMPESLRWMVAKGKPADEINRIIHRFDPATARAGYTRFHLSDERKTPEGTSPWAKSAALFHGALAIITPLIWVTYFCSSFAIYLRSSYGVLFLETLGLTRASAANIGSIGALVGAIAGVFLLMFTEKRGPLWIAIAPLLGVPLMLAVGWGLTGGPWFLPVIILGTVMVGAGHAAVISMTTIYYPSAVRSTGGGWASFMAKFAAVAAPIVGAHYFLDGKEAVLAGYVFTGLCLVGVVVGIVLLSILARRLHVERAMAVAAGDPLPEPVAEVAAGA